MEGALGGSISESKGRNTVSFCVSSIKEINEVIIPHFDKYKLLTQKQVDFELFKQVVELINSKQHLTTEGLIKIAPPGVLKLLLIQVQSLRNFLLRLYLLLDLKLFINQ